jgi:hypothetical protein
MPGIDSCGVDMIGAYMPGWNGCCGMGMVVATCCCIR